MAKRPPLTVHAGGKGLASVALAAGGGSRSQSRTNAAAARRTASEPEVSPTDPGRIRGREETERVAQMRGKPIPLRRVMDPDRPIATVIRWSNGRMHLTTVSGRPVVAASRYTNGRKLPITFRHPMGFSYDWGGVKGL